MKRRSLKIIENKTIVRLKWRRGLLLMILVALEKWLTLNVTHAKINKNDFQYYSLRFILLINF